MTDEVLKIADAVVEADKVTIKGEHLLVVLGDGGFDTKIQLDGKDLIGVHRLTIDIIGPDELKATMEIYPKWFGVKTE